MIETNVFCWSEMSSDSDTTDINVAISLPFGVINDSCKLQFTGLYVRDADITSAAECNSDDWSAEVKHENLPTVMREHEQVCYIVKHLSYMACMFYC